MTSTLIRKLLRDLRFTLCLVAFLLGAFQCLWYKVTERIIGQLTPFFSRLAAAQKITLIDIQNVLFEGPGKIIRTLIGGDVVKLERAMDMLSIGYVHPLIQTIFCIWAIGRAAGAIAGEIDRGTMELLLSQPLARKRLIFAHLCVDLITIPLLVLSLWCGTWVATMLIGPIQVAPLDTVKYPFLKWAEEDPAQMQEMLRVDLAAFGPALWLVGGLIFAVCGYTMWLSAAGRSRWRVLGLSVFITLLQFLVNLIGQMWDFAAYFRPLTIFYYFQPQKVILKQGWTVDFSVWNGGAPLVHVNMLVVLFGVGAIGYAMALWTFTRRDVPAPL
jgi:ABC-2 type transport system permease protein